MAGMRVGSGLAALALATATLAGAASAQPDPYRFTFPWAAHVDNLTGNYAARQFAEKRLPAGLAMSEAVERVRAARASCHGGYSRSDGVVCRYMIGSGADMAPLGQEIWTVTLTPGPHGKLQTVAVDRSRAGIPGEGGTRAVFHWRLGDD